MLDPVAEARNRVHLRRYPWKGFLSGNDLIWTIDVSAQTEPSSNMATFRKQAPARIYTLLKCIAWDTKLFVVCIVITKEVLDNVLLEGKQITR